MEMETIKDLLNFCNAAIFYEYKIIGNIEELNRVREGLFKSFYKTIPDSRIRVSVSIIDDMNLKINNNDIEKIFQKIQFIREDILYMLAFEKLIRDD